jgi:FKBP-type peptidyl-prolyl cis-trans isomerase
MSVNLVGSSLIIGCGILVTLLPITMSSKAASAIANFAHQQPVQKTLAEPLPLRIALAINKGVKTITTSSGLKYTTLKAGKGATPKPGQTVFVHYTGTLTNGKKFDSSRDRGEPFSFKLGEGRVIPGWDEALSTMKIGERRKLTIPPKLGYGATGAGQDIPPNATLIFDVELLKISD